MIATVSAGKSANEKLNIAVVGLRGRGKSLAGEFVQLDDVNIVVLCDVDDAVFAPTIKAIDGTCAEAETRRPYLGTINPTTELDGTMTGWPGT